MEDRGKEKELLEFAANLRNFLNACDKSFETI